jgi:hypothetical protein
MKYLIAILLFASTAIAQNNSGTLVIAPIRPQASNDTFPSAIANEIKGGPFSVATTTAMSNIPSERLVAGSLAYVANDGLFRIYDGTNWSLTNIQNAFSINNTTNLTNVSGVLAILNGGTGATNAGGARTNLGLGSTNDVEFNRITVNADVSSSFLRLGTNFTGFWVGPTLNSVQLRAGGSNVYIANTNNIEYTMPALYQAGLRNNGEFTNNGTIYGFKTNVGPFEGIGNFFASNNTTLSNETLFRVGLAEQTNRSAQFGFRVARTNNGGEGLAVFSVFGYNALMMIGPSDRSRSNSITNTNAGIEADIWSISPTNKVMTLITTNTGAMEMHRPIGFNTTGVATNPPANTTNVVGWIEMYVGTNSVRVPYYQ